MTSYPSAIDPELPAIRDDFDTLRENGMKHIADMIIATQTIVGTDFTDMTGLNSPTGEGGATKFGNCCSCETNRSTAHLLKLGLQKLLLRVMTYGEILLLILG